MNVNVECNADQFRIFVPEKEVVNGDVVISENRDGKRWKLSRLPEIGDLYYLPGSDNEKIKVRIGEDKISQIDPDKILELARSIQHHRLVKTEDVEEVDHARILEEIRTHQESPPDSVQVFEGDANKVTLEQFSGATSENILNLVHFIEANNLQEQRPWCLVWNLWRCLQVSLDR